MKVKYIIRWSTFNPYRSKAVIRVRDYDLVLQDLSHAILQHNLCAITTTKSRTYQYDKQMEIQMKMP